MKEQKAKPQAKAAEQEKNLPGPRAIAQQQRRQELIAASRKVLSQGYADFSMRKVAAEAGVRLNTVQHHFGDAQNLIEATVSTTIHEFSDAYRKFGPVAYESPSDNLLALIDLAFIGLRNPSLRRFFIEIWTMGLHNPAIRSLLRSCYQDYLQSVRDIVVKINPHLSEHDLQVFTTLIAAWADGVLVVTEWGDSHAPSIAALGERMKETCIAMLTKGMSDKPAAS